MQRVLKKVVVFLIFILTVLLSPSADIQAQQAMKPPSTAGPLPSIALENLKNRRSAIENRTDIDAAAKSDSLKYIDQAIAFLEMASSTEEEASEILQLIQAAPARLKILVAKLKRSMSATDDIAERARQMDTPAVEQHLLQKKADLIQAQNRSQEWDDRLAAEKDFSSQAAVQLAGARSRRKDVENELKDLANLNEKETVDYFRKLSLEAERNKLNAEIKFIELRQSRHNVIVELFSTERDVARKAVESRQQMAAVWQAEVQKRRQQEAEQAQDEARDAILQIPLLPKDVRDQFDINIQLSLELEDITREEAALIEKHKELQLRLKKLEEDY
ncbi:MAG: hypothetical protein PVH43_09500, partial [Desulfobacterales bacterium]